MAPRRFVVPLLVALVAGAFGALGTAPSARADDSICATKPENCVVFRMNVTGYVDGHAFDQFLPSFDCDHVGSKNTDSCTWAYAVVTTRTITITAQANNPAGVTVCISGQCGFSPQSKDFLLKNDGSRPPTANITINPTNGTTVNVSKTGSGTGSVSSDPGSIVCGSSCTWIYYPNTAVTLAAAVTGDSDFGGWNAGPCSGQDVVCHFTTGSSTTTENITATFVSPTPVPTSTPHATSTPVPTKSPSPTKTPTPSAGASTGPTFKPPTQVPGSAPPGVTPIPGATNDPSGTQNDIPATTDPNAAPTPTPFKVTTNDPNRTEVPLNALPSSSPTEPTGGAGSGPPLPIVIGLIVLLGALVGGGVFWWARRRPTPTG